MSEQQKYLATALAWIALLSVILAIATTPTAGFVVFVGTLALMAIIWMAGQAH